MDDQHRDRDHHPALRPIGANQKRYVLGERFTPACYMISVCHRVEGSLDLTRIEKAAEALVMRHEALRTAFRPVDGSYQCVVVPQASPRFHVIDLPDDTFFTFRDAALPLIMQDVNVESASSLVRFVVGRVAGGASWRVCFAAHHAVSDGVSRSLAMKQLFALYDGKDLPAPRSYYEAQLAAADMEPDRAYWEQTLASLSPEYRLVTDVEVPDKPQLGRFFEDKLDFGATDFRRLVSGTGASSFGCMAAVYALGLMRLTGQSRPLFAFQSAGRATTVSAMSVFGPFSNTLPLTADLDLSHSFANLAQAMQHRTESAVRHERLPFDQILKFLPAGLDFSLNAFPREHPPEAAGLVIHPREFLDRQSEFAINLVWSQDGSEMVGRAYYDAGRLSEARVADFLRVQKQMMQNALRRPEASLSEILEQVGGTATVIPDRYRTTPARHVIDRVVEVARTAPDSVAIRFATQTVTYGQLLRRADAFGGALLAAGSRPEDRVVILGPRSADLVAACLGAARAGASFAVLDPRYPTARLQGQIDLLRPKFLLRPGEPLPEPFAVTGVVECLPLMDPIDPGTLPGPTPNAPLYTLFTSGTTGQPKAVSHGLELLTFFTEWAQDRFSLGPRDCVTMLSGLNHDPVMRDIFLPLSSGGCLAVPTDHDLADPTRLRGWLQAVGATVVNLTPPMGRLIGMGATEAALSNLRLMIWGGDELSGQQVRQFQSLAPNAVQVNLYGATETPQAAALSVIQPDSFAGWRTAPIGRSMDWVRTECVTADGRICGPGETGTLRVTLPFPVKLRESSAAESSAKTVHETGDRAYVGADGQFVYIGRADDQIKIRGFRVGMREVATALESLPGVRRAMVMPTSLPDGSPALEAFCEGLGERGPEPKELALGLRRLLPEYMVPQRIHCVGSFPLLANGKIDRKALTEMGTRHEARASGTKAAKSSLTSDEQRILALFARVSGQANPDPADSLADLGADSLSMIEARLLLEEMQFDLPTGWETLPARDLAASLSGNKAMKGSALFSLARLESFVAVRSIAIFMIVAVHMGWFFYGGGATVLLFTIAGFTFGKFMLPAVLKEDSAVPLWRLLGKILLTIYPVSLTAVAWQAAHGIPIHPSTLGLFANFIPPTKLSDDQGYIFWLWYIHSYVQAFIIVALALGFPSARRGLRNNSFVWTITFAASCASIIFLWALGHGGWTQQVPWDDPVARLPVNALALIGIGMAATQATTLYRKLLLMLVTLLLAIAYERVFVDPNMRLMMAGTFILLFIPFVWVPGIVGRMMLRISGSSLFIYVMHWPLANLIWSFWWSVTPAILTITIIAICIVLWQFWQPVLRWIFDTGKPSKPRVPANGTAEQADL